VTTDPIVIVGGVRVGYPGPLVAAVLPEIGIGRLTQKAASALFAAHDAGLDGGDAGGASQFRRRIQK
jgi:hypothetical protein